MPRGRLPKSPSQKKLAGNPGKRKGGSKVKALPGEREQLQARVNFWRARLAEAEKAVTDSPCATTVQLARQVGLELRAWTDQLRRLESDTGTGNAFEKWRAARA